MKFCNAKKFCKEDVSLIENYEKALNDTEHKWVIHHRLETHNSDGERRKVDITAAELQALGMYYNRPAKELIFLTTREHNAFKKGKHHSEEAKRKMSEAKKCMTEETKGKMAEAHKGKHHSEEVKKRISGSMKGKTRKPFSEEWKKNMSEAAKKRWAKRKE